MRAGFRSSARRRRDRRSLAGDAAGFASLYSRIVMADAADGNPTRTTANEVRLICRERCPIHGSAGVDLSLPRHTTAPRPNLCDGCTRDTTAVLSRSPIRPGASRARRGQPRSTRPLATPAFNQAGMNAMGKASGQLAYTLGRSPCPMHDAAAAMTLTRRGRHDG